MVDLLAGIVRNIYHINCFLFLSPENLDYCINILWIKNLSAKVDLTFLKVTSKENQYTISRSLSWNIYIFHCICL